MSLLKFARILEGTIRTLSNLIEHFHQSFYYYLLSTTFRYISIGQYMITFGMLVGSVSIFLAAICIGEDVDLLAIRAIPRQLIFQAAGIAFYVSFIRLAHIPGSLAGLFLLISTITIKLVKRTDSAVGQYLQVKNEEKNEIFTDLPLKAKVVTLVSWFPVIMFLSCFSLLNFPFCLLASVVVGFIALVLRPTHSSRKRDILCAFGLVVVSLPVLHQIVMPYFPFDPILYAIFLHYRFSSLIFPFLTIIYFPFVLSLFSLAAWDI